MKKKTSIKKARGRPNEYDPAYLKQVFKLCLLGATDEQMANFFNVSRSTFSLWKKNNKDLSDTIKKGKIEADANVSNSLYHRALGYSHSDIHIALYYGKPVITKVEKHYPPDTVAAIFWLKNRQASTWREKQEIDHTSKGKQIKGFNYIVPKKPDERPDTND